MIIYKMYLTDLGLLVAMYGFEMKQAILDDTLTGPVKGGIYTVRQFGAVDLVR